MWEAIQVKGKSKTDQWRNLPSLAHKTRVIEGVGKVNVEHGSEGITGKPECYYLAINDAGQWFCDGKKIDPAVCRNRYER